MTGNLDIMRNLVSRKIYNLCFKEGLSKREISERLHGKWLPNAVLPTIKKLQKAGYLDFIEEGKNYQRKRGKYFATVLPILEFMKTLTEPTEEENSFLESESLKREFFRINKDLKLEDDCIRPFKTFLEDLLLFRLVNAARMNEKFLTTFSEICKQVIAHTFIEKHEFAQNRTKLHNSIQSHTKLYNSAQNDMKLHESSQRYTKPHKTLQYDRIVEKSIETFGEQYEIVESSNKPQDTLTNINEHQDTSKAITVYLKTDYLCLSLLMPERLCSRIKFSSPRGETFSVVEGLVARLG